jgi:hypothetical protein
MENFEQEESKKENMIFEGEGYKYFSLTVKRDEQEYKLNILDCEDEKENISSFFLKDLDDGNIAYSVFHKAKDEDTYKLDFGKVGKAKEDLPESIDKIPALKGLGVYLDAKDKSFGKFLLNHSFQYLYEEKKAKKVELSNISMPVFIKPVHRKEKRDSEKAEPGTIYFEGGKFRINQIWIPVTDKDAYSTDGTSLIIDLEKLFKD